MYKVQNYSLQPSHLPQTALICDVYMKGMTPGNWHIQFPIIMIISIIYVMMCDMV